MPNIIRLDKGDPTSLLGRAAIGIENASGELESQKNPRYMTLLGGAGIDNFAKLMSSLGEVEEDALARLIDEEKKDKRERRRELRKKEAELGKSENPEVERIYIAHERRLLDVHPRWIVYSCLFYDEPVDADIIDEGDAANAIYCRQRLENAWHSYLSAFKAQLLEKRLYGRDIPEAIARLEKVLREKSPEARSAYRQLESLAEGKPYHKDVEQMGALIAKLPDVALLYLEKIRCVEAGQFEHAARLRNEIDARLRSQDAKPVV
jgi:hypothetical protein